MPYGALAALVLLVVALGLTWRDYVALARHRSTLAARPDVSGEQERLIESVRRRLTEIQTEMAAWRAVHARIWEPLGPEAPGLTERSGVGGTGQPVAGRDGGPTGLVLQLEQLATAVGDEGLKLRALERLMARAGKVLAALPTRWPVRGAVNSEFGRRLSPWTGSPEHHSGMDIAAEIGTPVKAPAPGVVVFAGAALDFGNAVVIDHGHDIKTLFGHLQKIHVAQGQRVDRGQPIALSGNTGKSSGPHLHYEITVRGQSVNPRGYLWD